MRVIAGEFRGRKLLSPEGDQTRPVTDRVKQSIFDIVSPWIEGTHVYDVFAGTGSFGIESLSRGARSATFFESHRPTGLLLRKNLETLRVEDRSKIVSQDVMTLSLDTLDPAGMIFFDPPYRYLTQRPAELQALARKLAQRLEADGRLVFRHDAADSLELPGLTLLDERTYGGMAVRMFGASTD